MPLPHIFAGLSSPVPMSFLDDNFNALANSGGSGLISFLQGGTGAVLRTVQEKLQETVSVTDFMTATQKADILAYGYSQDCTVNFQKALTYITPGGLVLVPHGGYLISDTLYPSNGTFVHGYNVGDLTSSTAIKLIGVARPAFKFGTSAVAFNYGGGLGGVQIILTAIDSNGVRLLSTVGATLRDIIVSGPYSDFATRTNIAIDIDGGNLSAFFNRLDNVQTQHCHEGLVIRTTGSTSPTSQVVVNFTVSSGDYSAGDITSKGVRFENAGAGTVFLGGDLENCQYGIQTNGTTGASFIWFGPRFEANHYDLHLNNTGIAAITMLGSETLDPAKVLDNSGNPNHVIQYGVSGTVPYLSAAVPVGGLPVTAGYIRSNASADAVFTGTATGAAAGTMTVRYSKTGKLCTLTFDAFHPTGASSATPITIAGLPADLFPANDVFECKLKVVDNGSNLASPGQIHIVATGGSIVIYKDNAGSSFTSSANQTGFYGFSVSYRVA